MPYVLNETYLSDVVFGQHKVDYVVHGDDPCLDADGNDVFATSKAAGKYREIKRTEGVSTTDLVGRMLLMTKEHHSRGTSPALSPASSPNPKAKQSPLRQRLGRVAGFAGFLPTSRRIAEFSAPNRRPGPNDRIVYVDGAFDLLLPCHIRFLEKARELGDFLIVGVHRVMSRHSIHPALPLPAPDSCQGAASGGHAETETDSRMLFPSHSGHARKGTQQSHPDVGLLCRTRRSTCTRGETIRS